MTTTVKHLMETSIGGIAIELAEMDDDQLAITTGGMRTVMDLVEVELSVRARAVTGSGTQD